MRITRQILGVAAAGLLGFVPQLHAQSITFTGYATGCFYFGGPACMPGDGIPASELVATDFELQYVSTNFSGSTSLGGFLGIPSSGAPGSAFGVFGLPNSVTTHNYAGDHFALRVIFTLPSAPDALFSAILHGDVTSTASGGVNIAFGPNTTNLPFTEGFYSGTFDLTVADVNLGPGQHAVPITGNIQAHITHVTPEPASVALFATGLMGLVPLARRRKNAK